VWPTKSRAALLSALLALPLCAASALAQASNDSSKRFEKEGVIFDYAPNWQVSDQRSGDVQQVVLAEKALDAQIMITVLRSPVTSPQEVESAKHAIVEPTIAMVLKQAYDAGINVDRTPIAGEVAGLPAEGMRLRFAVDGFPGATEIYWLVMDKQMVNLVFIRPEKTASQATVCWDLIRHTIGLMKVDTKNKNKK
jgi:hypothetical protein